VAENTPTVTELNDLRTALASWRPDTADIYRKPASSADAYGGYGNTSAYSVLSSGNAVNVDSSPANEQERALEGIIGEVQVFYITFANGVDVAVDDKIILTSMDNIELRVRAVIAPESWELERRVAATRLGV
jgi:hypothetical protein